MPHAYRHCTINRCSILTEKDEVNNIKCQIMLIIHGGWY